MCNIHLLLTLTLLTPFLKCNAPQSLFSHTSEYKVYLHNKPFEILHYGCLFKTKQSVKKQKNKKPNLRYLN